MRDEIKSLVMVHANIFSLRIYFSKNYIYRNVNPKSFDLQTGK